MTIAIYRISHWLWLRKVPLLPNLLYVLVRLVFSAVIPPSSTIGKNVLLGYGGLGIVIHARAIVGDGVNIGPKVTIGGRSGYASVPVIEDDVLIGSGAQILGPVRIGRGAKIGANAVVLMDIPAGCTAVGVPAKIIHTPHGSSHAGDQR